MRQPSLYDSLYPYGAELRIDVYRIRRRVYPNIDEIPPHICTLCEQPIKSQGRDEVVIYSLWAGHELIADACEGCAKEVGVPS